MSIMKCSYAFGGFINKALSPRMVLSLTVSCLSLSISVHAQSPDVTADINIDTSTALGDLSLEAAPDQQENSASGMPAQENGAQQGLVGEGADREMVEEVLDSEPVISSDENLTDLERMMARAALSTAPLPSAIPSLFFTTQELLMIDQTRKGLLARPATDAEIQQGQAQGLNVNQIPVEPGIRELSVGGIIYLGPDDWAVWLNGMKIKPDRLPEEILDIQVSKSAVRLRWFDAYTNQIFPIRIKPYQRFNLDTRIFLPGSPQQEREPESR